MGLYARTAAFAGYTEQQQEQRQCKSASRRRRRTAAAAAVHLGYPRSEIRRISPIRIACGAELRHEYTLVRCCSATASRLLARRSDPSGSGLTSSERQSLICVTSQAVLLRTFCTALSFILVLVQRPQLPLLLPPRLYIYICARASVPVCCSCTRRKSLLMTVSRNYCGTSRASARE
ncbi:unnamed protein product, partial [Trichogramma brassicae]